MKLKKNKTILSVVIVTILILLIVLIIKNVIFPSSKKTDENKDSYQIIETGVLSLEREYLGLNFSGFVVETLNGNRSIYVYITNKNEKSTQSQNVIFILYDSSNLEIFKVNSTIKALQSNEPYTLKIPIEKDISNVFDYKVIEG